MSSKSNQSGLNFKYFDSLKAHLFLLIDWTRDQTLTEASITIVPFNEAIIGLTFSLTWPSHNVFLLPLTEQEGSYTTT